MPGRSASRTLSRWVTLTEPDRAVMVTDPPPWEVTSPVELTVATPVLDELQVICAPATGLP